MPVFDYAVQFERELQQKYSREMCSYELTQSNPGIKFINAQTIKLPKLAVSGYKDHNRASVGFNAGSVSNSWEPKTLEMTAEAVHTEVVNAGVMPFDTGNMQNAQTYVDTTDLPNGHVSLVTGSPQARRLYFHPEYNFQTVNNAHAGGLWYSAWIDGPYSDFSQKTFSALMAQMGGGS